MLDIQAEKIREISYKLLNVLVSVAPVRVALPTNEAIMEPVKVLWQTPPFSPPTAKYAERRYCIPSKGYEYFYFHPPPASLIVAAANE